MRTVKTQVTEMTVFMSILLVNRNAIFAIDKIVLLCLTRQEVDLEHLFISFFHVLFLAARGYKILKKM